MIMKYYINYNSNLKKFTIYVTGFDDDDEFEFALVDPREVRSDGTVKIPSGEFFDLATTEHISPNKETCFPVFEITDVKNHW